MCLKKSFNDQALKKWSICPVLVRPRAKVMDDLWIPTGTASSMATSTVSKTQTEAAIENLRWVSFFQQIPAASATTKMQSLSDNVCRELKQRQRGRRLIFCDVIMTRVDARFHSEVEMGSEACNSSAH